MSVSWKCIQNFFTTDRPTIKYDLTVIAFPLFSPAYGSNSKTGSAKQNSGCSLSNPCAEMVFSYPKKAISVDHVAIKTHPPARHFAILGNPPSFLPLPRLGIYAGSHSGLGALCLQCLLFLNVMAGLDPRMVLPGSGDPTSPFQIVCPDARFGWARKK